MARKASGKLTRGRLAMVEVHNKKIHGILFYVHRVGNIPYQFVFDVLCNMLIDGYVIGEDTYQVLLETALKRRAGMERPKW